MVSRAVRTLSSKVSSLVSMPSIILLINFQTKAPSPRAAAIGKPSSVINDAAESITLAC